MNKYYSKIAGSLYGLLVGDAMGCPVEGYSPSKIKREFGTVQDMLAPKGSPHPKGLHTDDGQQALAACDALLADPDHPGREFARIILDLFRAGPKYGYSFGFHRGTGHNFRQTVNALDRGASWDQAATNSAGNGAAMRIAPIALYFANKLDDISRAVVDISRVTHSDIRGIAASASIAFIVAEALPNTGPASINFSKIVKWVSNTEKRASMILGDQTDSHSFSEALRILLAHLGDSEDDIYKRIFELAGNEKPFGYPTAGYVFESVLLSIYIFLRSKDFENCLIKTISLGGDTDTIGAMVGAMCGALYGLEAIPKRWLADLAAFGELDERIDALVEKKHRYAPSRSLMELEGQWLRAYIQY